VIKVDLGLFGKSVFIAAASKGLGKATALEFANEYLLMRLKIFEQLDGSQTILIGV
jgi:hypothetical protein